MLRILGYHYENYMLLKCARKHTNTHKQWMTYKIKEETTIRLCHQIIHNTQHSLTVIHLQYKERVREKEREEKRNNTTKNDTINAMLIRWVKGMKNEKNNYNNSSSSAFECLQLSCFDSFSTLWTEHTQTGIFFIIVKWWDRNMIERERMKTAIYIYKLTLKNKQTNGKKTKRKKSVHW